VKKWYKSKTIIVNALVAALATLEASTGLLEPYLPGGWYVMLAVGLPVVNVMLRVITTQGVQK